MIIARSPLRITLGGGGTDLPSYYRKHGGFLLAAAIDKYVYIALHKTFEQKLILKYSRVEETRDVASVEHPIIREALRCLGFEEPRLEIVSLADIPAGTGLGSSGSFTTALLLALSAYQGWSMQPQELAERACAVEMDILARPVGKQDPYIAALGGVRAFSFLPDGRVETEPLKLQPEARSALEENLLLFYTGAVREASSILRDQHVRCGEGDPAMLSNLHRIKEIAERSRRALESGRMEEFAGLLNEHWELKKRRSPGIAGSEMEAWHAKGMNNGALGGKLIGAGGGGFLMFYAKDKKRLRQAMREAGLREVRFRFDDLGAQLVTRS